VIRCYPKSFMPVIAYKPTTRFARCRYALVYYRRCAALLACRAVLRTPDPIAPDGPLSHATPLCKAVGRSQIPILIDRFRQEIRAVARKPRHAAVVLFILKFADNIHYKFKSSQASKARLRSSKRTGTKQNSTQNGNSRSFKVTLF